MLSAAPLAGRADSPHPKSCSLLNPVTAGLISAPQEGRCHFHTVQIRSKPIQRRSPAMWAMQTDNASVTLRAEGSDLGSLPPVSTLVPAWVPGAHPLDQQLPLQALPAVLWPGTPCIPLYSSFTGLWAHSSTVWEEGFFFFFSKTRE